MTVNADGAEPEADTEDPGEVAHRVDPVPRAVVQRAKDLLPRPPSVTDDDALVGADERDT